MRHLSLWLDRYSSRRSQILDSWSGFARAVDEMRLKMPRERVFSKLESSTEPAGRLAFVDGGEGLRELVGLGMYFIRASGLVLSHGEDSHQGELFVRDLDMNVIDYDDHVKERVELLRDSMEYDVAIRCVEEHSPRMLFLDGSLYVKAKRKPLECMEYELYRKRFARLMRLCKRKHVKLVGVSEDSRSRLFAHHLTSEHKVRFPKHMTDSTILRILSGGGGYRSVGFTPESRFEVDDAGEGMVFRFPTAYLQPTELSNPLRIDVPDWDSSLDEAVSLTAALCRGSGTYGYPLPMYLAHLDAHIPPHQMDWTVTQMVSYLSKHDPLLANGVFRKTRRDSRPK